MELKEPSRLPLSDWLNSHLTRKLVFAIVIIGLVTWLLLCFVFLSELDAIIRQAYATTLPGDAELAVTRSLHQRIFTHLTLFSVCIFVSLAIAVYLLALAPIIRLRQAMLRYSDSGAAPEPTLRGDEVGKLQNTFVELVKTVDQKEQAERRLIASISHDIKTPLTSVLGYSERLRSAQLSPEKQRLYLDLVHEKALRLKAVVDEFDDYLDVGLRDSAPMTLMTAGELCGRLRREYEDELTDAGVAFQVTCRDQEAQFICSWEHMRRYFGNLISNSIKHAGAERLQLSLECFREGDKLVLSFSDNGHGVDPALLEEIFEPLYTSDQGRKVSGLGLSICKSIVKAHGGSIRARNVPAGGLSVHAILPCVELSAGK